jgi:tetratricopeptide (TPR) repeat protein
MRETLSKRQKGKAKTKVAVTRAGSKPVSKKKKELKKKPVSSHTASALKQRKISTAKVARKVAKNSRIKKAVKNARIKKVVKNARIKKAVKKATKTSLRRPAPKAASRPAKTRKKIVAKTQKKVIARARKKIVAKTQKKVIARAQKKIVAKTQKKVIARAQKKIVAKTQKKVIARAPKKVVAKKRVKTKSLRRLPMIVSQAPPPPEPPRRLVTSGALRAFEQAVKVFNRRHFEDAKAMFETVLAKYPGDVEIVARAQMYIQVCKQKLEQETKVAAPRNAEELYDHGVFALNIGDFTQARAFFEKALRLHPDAPHLLYSLAATHAQTGAHEEALNYLKRSIQIQPRFRSQAYNDADFSELRDNRQFLELVGLTSPFDLLESKR